MAYSFEYFAVLQPFLEIKLHCIVYLVFVVTAVQYRI